MSDEVSGTLAADDKEPMPIAYDVLSVETELTDEPTSGEDSSPKEPAPSDTPESDGPTGVEGAVKLDEGSGSRKKSFSWGWLIVLALALILVGGGFGFYALSNTMARASWESTIASGDSVATVTIPSLNDDTIPVLEGTSLETLRQGVGWYEDTAAPGEVGNFVLAGHRLGWGEPFASIGQLRIGDFITVSIGSATYTYSVVTAPTVVAGDDATILNPVPGGSDRRPTRRLITLTTAASLLPSPERLVVVGELVED